MSESRRSRLLLRPSARRDRRHWLRPILLTLLVALAAGCGQVGGGESTFRAELETALTAANKEVAEAAGMDLSDDTLACLAGVALDPLGDDELRDAGFTVDNVAERLVDLEQSSEESEIRAGIEEIDNCLGRNDFVAMFGPGAGGDEFMNCLFDQIGYESVREFTFEQAVADEAGIDPPDSAAMSSAADACTTAG